MTTLSKRRSSLQPIARAIVAAVVAIAVAVGAIVAEPIVADRAPTVAAAGYDPSNPFEWDDDWDVTKWYRRAELTTMAFTEAAGAYWKDLADSKVLRGKQIRADFTKYTTAGAVVLAIVLIDVIIDLASNAPSFEELLGDRVGALHERVGYLEAGLDALDEALDEILDRVYMSTYRERHLDLLVNGTGAVDTYYEQYQRILADIVEDPTRDQGMRLDVFFGNVMNTDYGVPSDWATLLSMLVGRNPLVDDFAQIVTEEEWQFDDRIRYAILFDYTTFWHMKLHQAMELMVEAYSYEMANAHPVYHGMIQDEIDDLLDEYHTAVVALWEPVGHPLTDDTVYTLGDRLIQRDLTVPVDDLHLDGHDWSDTLDMDTWNALVDLAEYGDGATMKEQLASLDVHLPAVVAIDEPCDDHLTLTFDTNFVGGGTASVGGDCTWMGFTETVEMHDDFMETTWLFGKHEYGMQHANQADRVYEGGRAHQVHKLHRGETIGSKGDGPMWTNKQWGLQGTDVPNAEINKGGAYGTIDEQEWNDLVDLAADGEGETMREQLADVGIDVPTAIAIDAPCDGQRTLHMRSTRSNGTDVNVVAGCTKVGFTETVVMHDNFRDVRWDFNIKVWDTAMSHRTPADGTYAGGQIHDVHDLHMNSNVGGKRGGQGNEYRNHGDKIAPNSLPPQAVYGGPWTSWYGWAALPSNSWSIQGDATFDVYHDSTLMETVTEDTMFTPGLVSELTLTTDAADVPSTGWAIHAYDLEGGEVTFSGLHMGDETKTYEISQGGYHHIHAHAVSAPTAMYTDLAVGDGGVVKVAVDGRVVDSLEEGTHRIPIPEGVEELVLTTEVDHVAQSGVVLVASADDESGFSGWTGNYYGVAEHRLPILTHETVVLGAAFDDAADSTVSVDEGASAVITRLPVEVDPEQEPHRVALDSGSGTVRTDPSGSALSEPIEVAGSHSVDGIDTTTSVTVDELSYRVNSFGHAEDVQVSGSWRHSYSGEWAADEGPITGADVTTMDGGRRAALVLYAADATPVAEVMLGEPEPEPEPEPVLLLAVDPLHSRTAGVLPDYAAGTVEISTIAGRTVIESTDMPLSAGYENPGTFETFELELTELTITMEEDGEVADVEVAGSVRFEDFSMLGERVDAVTAVDVDYRAEAETLVLDVRSGWGHEAQLHLRADAVTP